MCGCFVSGISLFIFGMRGLLSIHGWGEFDFCIIYIYSSYMDSVASSTWTPLGVESTFKRVIFTHFFSSFIS